MSVCESYSAANDKGPTATASSFEQLLRFLRSKQGFKTLKSVSDHLAKSVADGFWWQETGHVRVGMENLHFWKNCEEFRVAAASTSPERSGSETGQTRSWPGVKYAYDRALDTYEKYLAPRRAFAAESGDDKYGAKG